MDSVRIACAPRWPFTSLDAGADDVRFDFRWADIDAALQLLIDGDADLAEISFATWLKLRSAGDRSIEAAPIFPLRAFRHGLISVGQDATISHPSELRGRRVAIGRYVSTALVHLRGVLAHEYGVPWQEVTWIRTRGDADLWRIPN